MMDHHLRGLLLLGKVAALREASIARRLHEKVRRAVQFHQQALRPRGDPVKVGHWLRILQGNILDIRKRKFDFVTGGIIIDIVCQAGFVRCVEDDQIHCILAYSTPGPYAQRFAGEVMDD